MKRLVCVSNRVSLPRRGIAPGGLAVGVLAALRHVGGVWIGWSGEVTDQADPPLQSVTRGGIRFVTVDLTKPEYEQYYSGYCNGTLWPLFHYFPGRFRYDPENYDAYRAVNQAFARRLMTISEPSDVVWVHDYHLIPFASYLRREGFEGSIGFFLHIPFPHVQVMRMLPHYLELLNDLCQYDLLGFQTEDDLHSFLSCVEYAGLGEKPDAGGELVVKGRRMRVGVYPIGVDVDEIVRESRASLADEASKRMIASMVGRKLIVGVDRLDYSKGLIERFHAFEHHLETFPENQGKVTLLQIAPLSREDVAAYGEIRTELERTAGRLNGRFAEADWTPIRYLNRNHTHASLMGFLRAAQVGWVTPVRDGMNLVAKEFVAAQDPADPGVLILSPMAGAARELHGALLANPYDERGMAVALQLALEMPLVERRDRHRQMLETLRRHDIHGWYRDFCRDLAGMEFSSVR